MKKEKIIEYLYENNVRGDLTIEQMADDLADTPQNERSEFVKVSDRECPWCKAVCASTDKYCHECGWHIADAPQTETQNSNKNSNVISVYDGVSEAVRCAMCSNPNKSDRGCDGACSYDEKLYERIMKAIEESVADTPQTDLSAEEFVEGMKNLKMEVKRTDCDRYVVDEAGEKHYGCMGCQTDCPWK